MNEAGEIPVRTKKNRAILAILALSPGLQTTRSRVCGLLWGDFGEEQARSNLRQSLAVLRKELGKDHSDVLTTADDRVGLDPLRFGSDAVEFLQLAKSGQNGRASCLYVGGLLSDFLPSEQGLNDWLAEERRNLADTAIEVFEALAVSGPEVERVAHAKRLLSLDPYRETSHRILMQAYESAGDRGRALKQFEICRDLLGSEFGVEPSPQTIALLASIKGTSSISNPIQVSAGSQAFASTAEHFRNSTRTRNSIAVLPFDDNGDIGTWQGFGNGVAEDIAHGLRRFSEVAVYRENGLDRASFVLKGSIRRSENNLRVTMELLDVANGQLCWTQRYNRMAQDIFAIQDDVVEACVYRIVDSVNQTTLQSIRARRLGNLPAYHLFLQGRANAYHLRRDRMVIAREQLIAATKSDPEFAMAYSWLAEVEWVSWWAGWLTQGEHGLNSALKCAEHAVLLDPSEAFGFAELGQAQFYLGRRDQARHSIDQAIQLNPNDPDSLTIDAFYWLFEGSPERAEAAVLNAIRRDPFGHYGYVQGLVYIAMRRWEEAASVLGLLRTRIAESKLLLAAVLTMSGNADAADRAATEYRELLKENGRRSLSRNELLARFPFQKAADIAFVGDVLYAVGEQAFNGHADRDMV